MSSTIHSFGPKSARGLSCEVCCVDTSALVSSRVPPEANSGYALKHLSSSPARPVSRLTGYAAVGAQTGRPPDPPAPPTNTTAELSPPPASPPRSRPSPPLPQLADVPSAHDQDADEAGHDGVPDEHGAAHPLGWCVRERLTRRDHDAGRDRRRHHLGGDHPVAVDQVVEDLEEDRHGGGAQQVQGHAGDDGADLAAD